MTSDDEYELFLNHVYRLMERRQNVTTTYISVNAALTGVVAFLFRDGQLSSLESQIAVLALLFSGIVACSLWRMQISYYSQLMGWWYEQLRNIEATLQSSKKLITKEYQALFVKKRGKKAIGITRYEVFLTWLFTIIYFTFALAMLIIIVWKFL